MLKMIHLKNVIKRLELFTLAVVLCLFVIPPAIAQTDEEFQKRADLAHEINEWQGFIGGPGNASVFTARNMEDWRRLWAMVSAEPPVPFDPTREMAIGIFLGTRPTGGYSVKIISAMEEDGIFIVKYIEQRPGPDEFVIQALTTPYIIRIFPRTNLDIVFKTLDSEQLIIRPGRRAGKKRRGAELSLKEIERAHNRITDLERKIARQEEHIRELQEMVERIRRILPLGEFAPN